MSPHSVQTLFFDASQIFHRLWEESDERIYQLCAAGLHEIATEVNLYAESIRTSSAFLQEAKEHAQTVVACEEVRTSLDTQGIAFQLFESLAVMMREAALKTKQVSTVGSDICSFFETSGHWSRDQKTLVTDCYHFFIPKAYSAHPA